MVDIEEKLGNELFSIIEDNLGVSRDDLLSTKRFEEIIYDKKILIVSIKFNSNYGPMAIGRFVNLDHGTINSHIKNHKGLIISNKAYREKYRKIELLVNDLFVKFNSLEWKLNELLEERNLINKNIKEIRKRLDYAK
jgi:hypothetical protein